MRLSVSLTIYNTQSAKKEAFKPISGDKDVLMYVCGPTVYDMSHIGHARAYVVFDVVYRYLIERGYKVKYVRNLTDVDDKIVQKAEKEKVADFRTISEKYTDEFHHDMRSLGLADPDVEPKATEHIDEMIALISSLIDKGHAYAVDGNVFFSVDSCDNYGSLSGKPIEDLIAGARVEVEVSKKNPLDFALWKKVDEEAPGWVSPWGKGRPGWHIECSAMAYKHLGASIDIHGGGKDLVFPHHENEKAQSECGSGKQFVRYWVHNGFVNIDKQKMSKSLGNLVTVRQLLEKYHPEVMRHALLASHYRKPIDFSLDLLDNSKAALTRMYAVVDVAKSVPANRGELPKDFVAAMDDDFNTPKALAVIFDHVRQVNERRDAGDKQTAATTAQSIMRMAGLLGLLQSSRTDFQQYGVADGTRPPDKVVEALIEKRRVARQQKDFATADAARQELEDLGVLLQDRADGGTSWTWKP